MTQKKKELSLDLAGKKFNRLTGICEVGRDKHSKALWKFMCSCGTEHTAPGSAVKRGAIKSCGCYHRDNLKERNTTHGRSRTPVYDSWLDMHKRCGNSSSTGYVNYGGRGIRVCSRWESFENFYKDMGAKPKDRTLDRIDNEGNYEPSNCRWATRIEQCSNQRSNINIELEGVTHTLKQWSRVFNLPYLKLYRQVRTNGLPLLDAVALIRSRLEKRNNNGELHT